VKNIKFYSTIKPLPQRNPYIYHRPQKVVDRVEALNPEDLSQEELEPATGNDDAEKTAALNNGEQPDAPEASVPGLH
jgi:hypothetical protein